MMGENHYTTTTTKLRASRMHQPDMQVGDSDILRRWRLELGLTQKELGELLGTHKLHIAGQESGRRSIRKATINHLALIYAVNSLPPDAPVSIIQEMLVPPEVIRKRQKAMQARGSYVMRQFMSASSKRFRALLVMSLLERN